MKKTSIIIILILFFFTYSCQNISSHVAGTWIIKNINADIGSVHVYDLLANMIVLQSDNTGSLPVFDNDENDECTWSVFEEKNKVYIVFNGKNNFFIGEYLITDYDRQWSKMKLKSQHVTLECVKMWSTN